MRKHFNGVSKRKTFLTRAPNQNKVLSITSNPIKQNLIEVYNHNEVVSGAPNLTNNLAGVFGEKKF